MEVTRECLEEFALRGAAALSKETAKKALTGGVRGVSTSASVYGLTEVLSHPAEVMKTTAPLALYMLYTEPSLVIQAKGAFQAVADDLLRIIGSAGGKAAGEKAATSASVKVVEKTASKAVRVLGSWFDVIFCMGCITQDGLRCVNGTITPEEMTNRTVGNVTQSLCSYAGASIGTALFPVLGPFGGIAGAIIGGVVGNFLSPATNK